MGGFLKRPISPAMGSILLIILLWFSPVVSAGDCKKYIRMNEFYITESCGLLQSCCGDCDASYCCMNPLSQIDDEYQYQCSILGFHPSLSAPVDTDCQGYNKEDGEFVKFVRCSSYQFCCGDCKNRYCCSDPSKRLHNQDSSCVYEPVSQSTTGSNISVTMISTVMGILVPLASAVSCVVRFHYMRKKSKREAENQKLHGNSTTPADEQNEVEEMETTTTTTRKTTLITTEI